MREASDASALLVHNADRGGYEGPRGPGGARAHGTHGSHSDDSGPGTRRGEGKKVTFKQRGKDVQEALDQATSQVDGIRTKLGESNFKIWLGKQTVEQKIRAIQKDILSDGD